MPLDTKATLEVKIRDFPVGKIMKIHIWFEGFLKQEDIQKYIDANMDKIKEQLENESKREVHSIEVGFVIATNCRSEEEDIGDIILEKIVDAGPGKKTKTKKVEKKVFDIKLFEPHNTTEEDLLEFRDIIDTELFKRKHKLSDSVYDFFIANEDLVTVDQAKEICKTHNPDDTYLLRKREVRKIIQSKLPQLNLETKEEIV